MKGGGGRGEGCEGEGDKSVPSLYWILTCTNKRLSICATAVGFSDKDPQKVVAVHFCKIVELCGVCLCKLLCDSCRGACGRLWLNRSPK